MRGGVNIDILGLGLGVGCEFIFHVKKRKRAVQHECRTKISAGPKSL